MKNSEPVIEEPVGGVTVKSAPKNGSGKPGAADREKNGHKGDPRQKGKPVPEKQIGKRSRKEKRRGGEQSKILEEGLKSHPPAYLSLHLSHDPHVLFSIRSASALSRA